MNAQDQVGWESTRRDFLKQVGLASAAAAVSGALPGVAAAQAQAGAAPWYRRTYRWAQTNITEIDSTRYDIPWWRQHWKRTEVQGVIINAAGIVAYYPSKIPFQYRPPQLGDRDLYGEIAKAAHDDGLVVLARMDSNRVHEDAAKAHPEWLTINANGQPYMADGLWLTCINSTYYEQHLPSVLREIIERSHPEGFTDNSWSGLTRNNICYCKNCIDRFNKYTSGKDLPPQANWDDPVYRQWIEWNYARRIEIWDFNNKITRDAGGPNCLWMGMNSASIGSQSNDFRPFREICERSEIIMLDHQTRPMTDGFQHNAFAGRMIHGMLGWNKLIPESMPMYQNGPPARFRLSAKTEPEARLWMLSGFAGGIQPWYHHVAAYHEDRRAYLTAEPIMKWHKANEQYLVDRVPVANVGIVWSQRNADFFGRDNAEALVEQPLRGFVQAMIRARIPFIPVNAANIDRESGRLNVLVLPNVGVLSDSEITSIRGFVRGGGALVASGQTSLYDNWGDPRPDAALADLLGMSGMRPARPARGAAAQHTYLRLTPELRGQVYGPKSGDEPAITGKRHPVLAGLDETDIVEYGGSIQPLTVAAGAQVLATFIPAFPAYPPEMAWMRTPKTDIPAIVLSEANNRRAVYFAADLDRQYAVNNFPDHGDLLANAIRWAGGDTFPLQVRGYGLIDCELYEQPGRMILHLVNVTNTGTWRAPVQELIPVGPVAARIRLPKALTPKTIKLLVGDQTSPVEVRGGWVEIDIGSIIDHEVIVVE